MEPDSRYLCVVEGSASKVCHAIFRCPSKGNRVLSLILSKAFLLANDRGIKEDKILRQLPPLPA